MSDNQKIAQALLESGHAPIDRELLVQYVRRWGGSTSDAVLDPVCKVFTTSEIQGFIGYRKEWGCSIALGDPVCATIDRPQLVQAFHRYCQELGSPIIYLSASEEFAKWSIKHACKALVEFGQEYFLDPHNNPRDKHGTHASLVRRKVRHAIREGTEVQEYLTHDELLEEAMQQVGLSWLQARRGPQVYISHVRLFADRPGKRWFYASQKNRIVGLLLLNQLKGKQGWLLNHLMIKPDAPHGTPELLVITALETLQQERCHFVTVGSSPAKQLGEIIGLGKCSSWFSRQIFKTANKFLHLNGHQVFWEKFHPHSKPSYLLFSQPRIGIYELLGLIRALNISL